ncbi:aminotransferase class III-fold pyridoxal phosphate-dependent enzyme [uncultured Anaeromusa sp.]|uniref:aminotransferase class III-fold pyridoxal phosphate-dependent enzyme n=1 Tax=uncultured Anaeromusa sp. TaxID=673273 RepID=UPI0029C5FDF2|nr:aminotransferase class III-fold pyridoxal phosphate-dependent enzyme [uncultured Anaeromusa sp.]
MSKRYQVSEEWLNRALKSIPLGTQTFSKSRTQYPFGVSPYYAQKAKGCRLWDVDGNEYIDCISSLCSVTLGYNDPDVTQAVREQLEDGVIFSLPHKLEVEVSEEIIKMVPSAEMVRFGKNGSDATSGAIRLARAYTGRDRVAVCGYHGWQDWYIGSTARNKGVPKSTQELTHSFVYNQIETLQQVLKQHPGEFAAVIMEAMNVSEPQEGFLQEVQTLAKQHGALFILDETITGFRYANGGAQELFGLQPDLATFGKGLANGYPVSAVAGRADIMKLMEEIFFSFTFGGETLSLAASLATMKKLQREPVVETIRQRGSELQEGLKSLIASHEVESFCSVAGHPSWSFFVIKDTERYSLWQIKTLFLQEMFKQGILTFGTHNINYAHQKTDVQCILQAYDKVLPLLGETVKNNTLEQKLECAPLEPLFKIR